MSSTITTTSAVSSKPRWQPKPYQLRALQLMMRQGSVGLFLDPGLGKTSICLKAFSILKGKGLCKRMLIIAPLRPAYKVWPDEIRKWADFEGLTFSVLHGKNKDAARQADTDIHIINPEGLKWLTQFPLNYDVLCIDESTKFKDSTTQRFKALRPLIPSFSRRWILTGTPVPNGLMDLFGQIYVLDLGRSLGRFITHYRRQFFTQTGYGGYEWTPRYGAFEEVIEQISPLILQLSAEEYLEMPELVYRNIVVALDEKARRVYDDLEDEFITEVSGKTVKTLTQAAAGTKCRQVANGAIYTGNGREWVQIHDEKLDALEDLLEELGGRPVLVLYEFDHDRARIQQRLDNVPCLTGMVGTQLDRTIDAFNRGDLPVVLGHPGSMGHGLNLQGACCTIIWFGITWNLELYDQAIARVYRQGQKSERVFIYHIVAAGTLDEKVLKVLTSKDKNQQSLLAALHEAGEQG